MEKIKCYKNKKILTGVWIVIFLIIYYLFFAQWKVNLNFSAEDLVVKIIDNKQEFEDKIVKNIYDKVVESCEEKDKPVRYRWNSFNIWIGAIDKSATRLDSISDNSIRWWWLNLKTQSITSWDSFRENSISDSIWSIDFDGSDYKEVEKVEWVSFSRTNIQKQKVDEWDILKQTEKNIFYFSKNKSKIYIIKSPIDWNEIDLENVETIYTINIPSNLTLKPELFVNDNRLVYLASKKSYNNNNTIVWIYDISNLENRDVKLHKIFETKWDYFKSRLIDDNLYLVSNYSLSPFKSKFCNVINNGNNSWSIWEFISFFTWININTRSINKELYEELKEELESYSYKFNQENLWSNWISSEMDDFKVFYTNKDLNESIENLNFNIISVVDIDEKENKSDQTLIFWNLKNGEIHMTLDNLYLVNSYYKEEKWKCDYIDICYKEFASNNFTSISKISLRNNSLSKSNYTWPYMQYLSTSIIPWKPINQYSMDEDEWYFRIFTAHGNRNRDAALYVFDKKFKLIWELEKIKPREEFKSSRFIWDKAFLVTFRQKDPLFVIDLHIPSEPKIIWELHIPGYSSYLHPYWKVWNKEYLIWIWQERRNVKVDLYEIDYDKKNIWWQVDVKQKYKYIFERKSYNWDSSISPAETNPRSFVWDKNEKLLYLPIEITPSSITTSTTWICRDWEEWCYVNKKWELVKTKHHGKLDKFIWLKELTLILILVYQNYLVIM